MEVSEKVNTPGEVCVNPKKLEERTTLNETSITVDERTDTWGFQFVLDPAFSFQVALMDTFPPTPTQQY